MKQSPCKSCLVVSICEQECDKSIGFTDYIDYELKKLKPFAWSKNGHLRKHIPDRIRKHWNALMKKRNDHVIYWNERLEKILKREV